MVNNYVLGLDIGVTSVGWGIIDENHNIVDAGVRLFEEADASNNETRREKRGARRVKRRRKQRIIEMKRLLKANGLIDDTFRHLPNPYEIRVKGIRENLTNDELATALLHIVKRRGSTLDVEDLDTEDKDDQKAKDNLASNVKVLKDNDQYICEVQLDRLENNGELRGNQNIFKTEDFVLEVEKLLSNQNVNDTFIKDVIDLIERKRHYSEGPGSETSPTPYGRFREDSDGNIFRVNLIQEMRGKCSVYPEELRAPAQSFSAELFNFLNDLNNLKIAGSLGKLNEEQKESLINEIKKKGYLSPKADPQKAIAKILDVDPDQIAGFRVNTKGKPIITEFKGYQKFIKAFKDANQPFEFNALLFDKVSEILTENKLYQERKDEMQPLKEKYNLSDDLIDKFSKLSSFDKFHGLSLKAMNTMIDELKTTTKNQMQIITDNNLVNIEKPDRLTIDESAILSPVAKRAHKESLKVVEALQKDHGYFNKIVIETTRAKNSKDEKDNIKKAQERNKKRKDEAKKLVEDQYGDVQSQRLNGSQILKLRLYNEQDGKCAYTYNPLSLDAIVNNEDAYEIDHIIPYSISLDNSYNNKVLVENTANQKKGNTSPYHYFMSGKAYGNISTYEQFKKQVLASPKYNRLKKGYLLNEEDITKFDALEEFTARNLVDTSYAVRSLLSSMKKYYKAQEIPTKIFTVKGKVTNLFRHRGANEIHKDNPNLDENPLIKDREKYHHHAIDALIAARLSEQRLIKNLMYLSRREKVDMNTGEIIQEQNSPLDDNKLIKFVKSLAQWDPNDFKFSWKVDKKPNRKFSDETIYSTRLINDEEFVIKKHKDIYALDKQKLSNIFNKEKERKKLLVYNNDNETYKILEGIYQQFSHEKYPFAAYKEQHGDYIRKFAKNHNGPAIKQLKYKDSRLGNHLDISNNYNVKDKKVVLQQISPYRTDFYRTPEGTIKFVTIRYSDLDMDKNGHYIPKEIYYKKLANKGISDASKFIHSFNRNEIIRITKQDNSDKSINIWRFIATSNDKTKQIEVKSIDKKDSKRQIMLTMGAKIINIEKISVSSKGNKKIVENESLKLRV